MACNRQRLEPDRSDFLQSPKNMEIAAAQCHLLLLPRELRDIIYEFALTEARGLVAYVARGTNAWTRFRALDSNKTDDHNQLRFSCRQLHAETNGLSLRYNHITFCRPHDEAFVTVYDLFDRFYSSCSIVYLRDIRRITILDSETPVPKERVLLPRLLSRSLIKFCQQHPKATVIVRFRWGSSYKYIHGRFKEYVDCMMHLSMVLGRPNPFPMASCTVSGGLAGHLIKVFSDVKCTENLRFSFGHVHDERRARKSVYEINSEEEGEFSAPEAEDNETWLEIARRMHENGV